MLANINSQMRRRRETLAGADRAAGFTLVELLVVMIIIGILAAIAIPVFLNQRQQGYETATKSDVRALGNEMESAFTSNGVYPTTLAEIPAFRPSNGTDVNSIKITTFDVNKERNARLATVTGKADGFCVEMKSTEGDNVMFTFDSIDGGLNVSALNDKTCAQRGANSYALTKAAKGS